MFNCSDIYRKASRLVVLICLDTITFIYFMNYILALLMFFRKIPLNQGSNAPTKTKLLLSGT